MAWTVFPKVMGKLADHLGGKSYHVNLALYHTSKQIPDGCKLKCEKQNCEEALENSRE